MSEPAIQEVTSGFTPGSERDGETPRADAAVAAIQPDFTPEQVQAFLVTCLVTLEREQIDWGNQMVRLRIDLASAREDLAECERALATERRKSARLTEAIYEASANLKRSVE